jgi:acetoin utilization deacetylase AcuC-like enzyme
MVKLAVVDDDLFLEHAAPYGHPEREARLIAARRGLAATAERFELLRLGPRDATIGELSRVHAPAHCERVLHTRGRVGQIDADTYFCERSAEAAVRAAGGAIALIEALADGVDYGIGLIRPPGHHATAERAMGFCLFNNVAVAAAAALDTGAAKRVLILDWDVHHGNGTEAIFYDRSDVLYVSLHESPQYPGTGRVSDVGTGDGKGYNVNLPLSAGADDAVYATAFLRVVGPVVSQFNPDLVLVSAGYDAHERDPLGGMAVTDAGFGELTSRLLARLPDRGRGRVAFVLEGGYDERGIEGAVRETLLALLEARPDSDLQAVELSSRHGSELRDVCDAQAPYWAL